MFQNMLLTLFMKVELLWHLNSFWGSWRTWSWIFWKKTLCFNRLFQDSGHVWTQKFPYDPSSAIQ
jgi:hypothetical protein